jgi:hypothetical protein
MMGTLIYSYDKNGYFTGAYVSPDDSLSFRSTYTPPSLDSIGAGFIPRWDGATWSLVENHIREKYYIDGEEFTMNTYGPLPEGASTEAPPEPEPEAPPEPEPITLAQAKNAKRKEMIYARNNESETTSVLHNGVEFWCDKGSKSDILLAIEMFRYNESLPPIWFGRTGQLPVLDIDTLMSIAEAIENRVNFIFQKYFTKQQEIEAAETVEEVNAIVWGG